MGKNDMAFASKMMEEGEGAVMCGPSLKLGGWVHAAFLLFSLLLCVLKFF